MVSPCRACAARDRAAYCGFCDDQFYKLEIRIARADIEDYDGRVYEPPLVAPSFLEDLGERWTFQWVDALPGPPGEAVLISPLQFT
jgi:hypothetical protein